MSVLEQAGLVGVFVGVLMPSALPKSLKIACTAVVAFVMSCSVALHDILMR